MAVAAASSPVVEIAQQGDALSIKTSTSVRTTNVSFTVGQSFSETTVDGRACTVQSSPRLRGPVRDDGRPSRPGSALTPSNPACSPLQSFPKWESDRKISCEQTLQKGDGPKTGWTRELTNDGELVLVIKETGGWGGVSFRLFHILEPRPRRDSRQAARLPD